MDIIMQLTKAAIFPGMILPVKSIVRPVIRRKSSLSRRKNTSLGNLDFADKRVRYFEDRVESLPNSQRLLALGAFALGDLEARHNDLLERLAGSYGVTP